MPLSETGEPLYAQSSKVRRRVGNLLFTLKTCSVISKQYNNVSAVAYYDFSIPRNGHFLTNHRRWLRKAAASGADLDAAVAGHAVQDRPMMNRFLQDNTHVINCTKYLLHNLLACT